MIFVTSAGLQGIPDFLVLTWITLVIGVLVMVFGTIRMHRAQGNPVEHAKGTNTAISAGLCTPILMFLIEIPHMLFFS